MIIRIWHGYTSPENARAYEELLKTEVFVEIQNKQVEGYKGIQLLKRELNDEVEFITMMQFTSLDAVKAFAGEEYEKSYVPAAARRILKRFDEKAMHYERKLELTYP